MLPTQVLWGRLLLFLFLLLGIASCEQGGKKEVEPDLIPPEALSLSFTDTGVSATDNVTQDGTITIANLEASASWQYSEDNGTTWNARDNTTTSFVLAEGVYSAGEVQVYQTDEAGNDSPVSRLEALVVDQSVDVPQLALVQDTGNSSSDNLTQNGVMAVSGLEAGAIWEFSVDSGWNWTPGVGTSVELPPRVYLEGTFQVRQTDLAGNQSEPATLGRFEVDTTSLLLTFQLLEDTGSASDDFVTQNGIILVQNLEVGARWEYSQDNGSTWDNGTADNFTLPEGRYAAGEVQVRQVDPAGNPSTPDANEGTWVIDQTPPAAPAVALKVDSGSSSVDGLTRSATLVVSGLEDQATWEASEDNGSTWKAGVGTEWTPTSGTNWPAGTLQVRQTDRAGNRSSAGSSAQAYFLDDESPTVTQVQTSDNVTLDNLTAEIIPGFAITFSEELNPSTVTVNSDTSCSQSIQVSADGFSTCLPLTQDNTTDNQTFPFSFGASLVPNTVYTLRVTQNAQDQAGNAATVYQQENGVGRPLAVLYSYIKADNAGVEDQFGQALAMNTTYLAVGTPREDSEAVGPATTTSPLDNATDAGAVYVYTNNTVTEAFQLDRYVKADNTGAGDLFGSAVAISEPPSLRSVVLVVGAPGESSNQTTIGTNGSTDDTSSGSGAVYVYTGSSFKLDAYLKADNADVDDAFGSAVAVEDNGSTVTVAVGAPLEDSNQITISGSGASDSGAVDSGAVYVFQDNGSGWTSYAYVKANNAGASDHFGASVAYENGILAVGAPLEDGPSPDAATVDGSPLDSVTNSGAVYVFKDNGTTFVPYGYLKATSPDSYDEFGTVVSLDNGTLYVGTGNEDSSLGGVFSGDPADNAEGNSGAVYVFQDNGSHYALSAFLKASHPGVNDAFGDALAVDNGTVWVGSAGEDSALNTVAVTGSTDDSLTDAGAAFFFKPSDSGSWNPVGFFKADQAGADDALGHAVALSRNFLVVAAPQEDSGQQGVTSTGSTLDNVSNSGAIYVFKFLE